MLKPYSQLKQETYLAPQQSIRADLSSIKTFGIAFVIFFASCLIISFIAHTVLTQGLGLDLKFVFLKHAFNPLNFSALLSTATGCIVFIKSSLLRKITFNFPMIKAFQPKNTL